jgi:hypothetical protein
LIPLPIRGEENPPVMKGVDRVACLLRPLEIACKGNVAITVADYSF